jgi:hypothetical protein
MPVDRVRIALHALCMISAYPYLTPCFYPIAAVQVSMHRPWPDERWYRTEDVISGTIRKCVESVWSE